MSNNNESSTEWYREKMMKILFDSSDNTLIYEIDIFNKAKEMHKKEMVMFVLNVMGNYKHGDVLFDVATKLYTETYEGGEK
jgi:hypothetical protein